MQKELNQSGYVLDEATSVWHKQDKPHFAYSDGDTTENLIHDIIANAQDRSLFSIELMSKCTDWPTTYHLHPTRANLLRPLTEFLQGEILEIGCGCGAITRYLGELGAKVLCVEGSPRRAKIARLRTADLDNIEIVTDNFLSFKLEKRFDVVTLIGVLEYARKYADNSIEDGIQQVLKKAATYLKPDGKLFIAIENQLGLKYFAGFAEDHYGVPMLGIENRYPPNNVVTFGRKVLSQLVADAGLKAQYWWYPFPDYKLPTFIVTERGAKPDEKFVLASPLRAAITSDYQYPTGITFKLEQALTPIIENGLIAEMANSFLLVASQQASVKPDQTLGIYYSTARKKEYAKQVVFKKAATKISVMTQHLSPKKGASALIQQQLNAEAYVKGFTWHEHLSDLLAQPGWDEQMFKQWARYWIESICKFANIQKTDLKCTIELDGKFIDAIPRNLIIQEDDMPVLIDQEWISQSPVTLGYLVFRGLLSSLNSLKHVAQPNASTPLGYLQLIGLVFNENGLHFDETKVTQYIDQEVSFSTEAKGYSSYQLKDLMDWLVYAKLNVSDTNIPINALQNELNHLRALNAQMKKSLSWQITKPLRFIENKIKGKT